MKQFGKNNDSKNDNVNEKFLNGKRPCSIYDKLDFEDRFHSENVCRYKDRQIEKLNKENIKVTNNNDIQQVVANYKEAKKTNSSPTH